jgi:hypothetical protein
MAHRIGRFDFFLIIRLNDFAAVFQSRMSLRSSGLGLLSLLRANKSSQLLHDGPGCDLVQPSGAPFDPDGVDTCNLRSAYDRWRGQSRALEVDDIDVARPPSILAARDHCHPNDAKGRQLGVGDDQGGTALFCEVVGVGKGKMTTSKRE